MGRLAELAGIASHVRTIETSTRLVDEARILCSGRLADVRLLPTYRITGETREAGTLHDFALHVLVGTPDLIIEDIEVEIKTVPRADCRALERSLDAVRGLRIAGGFSAKVKELAGGPGGCTHLAHLLVTMAPAILQGYWALLDRSEAPPAERSRRAAASLRFLTDSCHAWRAGGDAHRALSKLAEER